MRRLPDWDSAWDYAALIVFAVVALIAIAGCSSPVAPTPPDQISPPFEGEDAPASCVAPVLVWDISVDMAPPKIHWAVSPGVSALELVREDGRVIHRIDMSDPSTADYHDLNGVGYGWGYRIRGKVHGNDCWSEWLEFRIGPDGTHPQPTPPTQPVVYTVCTDDVLTSHGPPADGQSVIATRIPAGRYSVVGWGVSSGPEDQDREQADVTAGATFLLRTPDVQDGRSAPRVVVLTSDTLAVTFRMVD